MDLIVRMKTADMFLKLMTGQFNKVNYYDHVPQKKALMEHPIKVKTVSPESVGVKSSLIEQFLDDADHNNKINMHSFVFMRYGKIIAHGSFAPYMEHVPHSLYSASKSVTATAVGMLMDEGKLTLDERLIDIFPDKRMNVKMPHQDEITVRHLLTMTSEVPFNETGSMLEDDWVKAFMESMPKVRPGKVFHYNSMNTYMLSVIVRQKTGDSLLNYLKPRLFDPLQITDYSWETCPKGIEKGGWGLSLNVFDIAKIGQLYLNGGMWQGKRLLSEQWVKDATAAQIRTKNGVADEGYGYCIWQGPGGGVCHFNGAFGQLVYMDQNNGILIGITSGNPNLFTVSETAALVRKFMGSSDIAGRSLPPDPAARRSLAKKCESLKQSGFARLSCKKDNVLFAEVKRKYDKTTFEFEESKASLLPLVIQSVYLNYSRGLSKIRLDFEKDSVNLTFTEGTNINTLTVPASGEIGYSDVTFGGDVYRVGVAGKWSFDLSTGYIFRISISFIETPNTRSIKLALNGDKAKLRCNETPSVLTSVSMLLELMSGGDERVERVVLTAVKKKSLRKYFASMIMPETVGSLVKNSKKN